MKKGIPAWQAVVVIVVLLVVIGAIWYFASPGGKVSEKYEVQGSPEEAETMTAMPAASAGAGQGAKAERIEMPARGGSE